VMLTSRTHYFEHTAKEDEVLSLPDYITERPEFQVLYLNPFTRQQIEAYLDRVRFRPGQAGSARKNRSNTPATGINGNPGTS